MELFSQKNQCCGCMACIDVCPQNAIEIKADFEGFLYPKINQSLCVDCKYCKTVCPFEFRAPATEPCGCFAVQAKEKQLRETSTSGAAFPILAESVLKFDGAVYGAAFDASMCVTHQRVQDKAELKGLMQSKYVQSKTVGIYQAVQRDLQNGKQVLFSGTPCQVEALRRFLQKPFNNLFLVDLICYGVPSPGAWERYVHYLEKKHDGVLTQFHFRDKRQGDCGHTVSYMIGNDEYIEPHFTNLFMSAFYANGILRPSCYACPFATVNRRSDITIGDFWGVEKVFPFMEDGMGTSLIIVHTSKGMNLWNCAQHRFHFRKCERETILQPRLISSTEPVPNRQWLAALYQWLPLGVLVNLIRVKKGWRGWRVHKKNRKDKSGR